LKFYYKLWKINDDLVVILAGYKEPMDKFYESNPGLSSRIANHIDFPDYTVEELLKISKLMLEEQQYQLTPAAEVALKTTSRNEKKDHYSQMLESKNVQSSNASSKSNFDSHINEERVS
jgi:hypothetical protein